MARQLTLPPWVLVLSLSTSLTTVNAQAYPQDSCEWTNYSSCRCFPGDSCWPTTAEWTSFNESVGGRLVATVPIAASCHHSALAPYDASTCEDLRANWWFPETHVDTSSSPMAPFWANASCDPFTAPQDQCVIGAYVQYAVKAAGVADYQATLAFAAEKNIRLVIRNTGHDYYGKSTGAGALALWTRSLQDTEFIPDYKSDIYSGKALKLGAGVDVFGAYEAADAAGIAVMAGSSPTVGVAGGFSQGGGHGPLMSVFGLGSDQVLEWEVVTAQGTHLVASPSHNADLYWALSGGGGGTYAAVVSLTVRGHQLRRVSAATLTFTNANVSEDIFLKAVQAFFMRMPTLGRAGIWASWLYYPGTFSLVPIVGPDLGETELQSVLQPTLSLLKDSSIQYDYTIHQSDNFLETYNTMFSRYNITQFNIGGRLIPASLVETEASTAALLDVLNNIMSDGVIISGAIFDVSAFPYDGVQNSVNPVWRDAILDLVIGIPYDPLDFQANVALMTKMTNVIMPQLEELTPGGGVYLNEGDPQQPDWQTNFYGQNYPKLEEIKAKYDPKGLFYGRTAVGAEKWIQEADGRLCLIA